MIMPKKNELDAMILKKVHIARERGIDLFPVIEFFTSSMSVFDAKKYVEETKDLLCEFFLRIQDCEVYQNPCSESFFFLRQMNETLNTCIDAGEVLKPIN